MLNLTYLRSGRLEVKARIDGFSTSMLLRCDHGHVQQHTSQLTVLSDKYFLLSKQQTVNDV